MNKPKPRGEGRPFSKIETNPTIDTRATQSSMTDKPLTKELEPVQNTAQDKRAVEQARTRLEAVPTQKKRNESLVMVDLPAINYDQVRDDRRERQPNNPDQLEWEMSMAPDMAHTDAMNGEDTTPGLHTLPTSQEPPRSKNRIPVISTIQDWWKKRAA